MRNFPQLASVVQYNCDISDARHAGDYGLCSFLLKMREYYRWENEVPLTRALPKDELGEWLTTRWVLKHAELYQFFAGELTKINPKFDEIAQIPSENAQLMLRYSVNQFGATTTYIFSILNSVMFAEEDYLKLREAALKELETKVIAEESAFPQETVEAIKSRYEKEIQKLTDRYEKRLQGVERKYFQDVEGLRKQISQLHKKIGEMCASAVR